MFSHHLRTRSFSALNLFRSSNFQEKCICHRQSTTSLRSLLHTTNRRDSIEKDSPETLGQETGLRVEKTSKAMKAYLERAQKYNAFITEKRDEFATGKRHLANMMGVDHSTFTQKDIDEAIEYLFPSGLFVPAARPLMKPPEEVFPPKKDAEFDDVGRPFHSLFYTGKPNYYQLLHDLTENLLKLNRYEDTMISKQVQPDPNIKIELAGSDWIPKEKIELQLVEEISEKMYANLIELLARLASHPYSYTIKDEIFKYRVSFMTESSALMKQGEVQYDDQGRAYVKLENIPRKTARANVTLYNPGTGKIVINGTDLSFFDRMQSREQILFPLQFTGLLNKVDIEANVTSGGSSSQAGAIRFAVSLALRHFVDEDLASKMRIAGLLTRDVRRRERKKFGQMRARRKYTWKKR